jgi:cyanophycin synthetase
MEIIRIRVINGPNYWSIKRKKLIVLTLNLDQYDEVLTTKIPEFIIKLKTLLPTLYEHCCSEGVEGGFFTRLTEGTLLGHVLEHVALELQNLAGMNCSFGRARMTSKQGIYKVVFSYEYEEAGILAAESAFRIVSTLAEQKDYLNLEEDIQRLNAIYRKNRLGPSTEAILEEARLKDIPYTILKDSLIVLGHGIHQKIFSATVGHNTSCLGVDIASDKNLTKMLLDFEFIPTPKGYVINSIEDLKEAIDIIGFPLVIKPRYGNHGKGITTNIISLEKALLAFAKAQEISNSLIAEKFIEGDDYRFLLINYKLVAVAKRTPPHITGDGTKTIKQLIDDLNQNPLRGEGHENILTQITINETTLTILKEQQLTLEDILPMNKIVFLRETANISTGGTATDVTDIVHKENVFLAERVARTVNLDVCGIDIIAKDITKPINSQNGAILEVNAAPGFRMHLFPTVGQKRNVAKAFIEMLYPVGQPARIPIIAVTGTNGKTTVVRLIAYIAEQAKYRVGMTTTEGVYVNKKTLYRGDCSGPRSAAMLLRDPTIDFAVLECARGGILRSGLAFDKCSVSIVTNISEDHIGMDDINSLNELAKIKSVLPQSTDSSGYSILNAEDEIVYSFRNNLKCHIALFSLTRNKKIEEHIQKKQLCCFVENEKIWMSENGEQIEIIKLNEIPLTLNGVSESMTKNVLTAILGAYVNKINLSTIVFSLKNFFPNSKNLPGRMNIFDFDNCKVMLDYAHNEEAYISLSQYLATLDGTNKIAVIAGTGDRRDSDIWKTGYYAAKNFDEIIIRHDKDSRGRTYQEINDLIINGIMCVDNKKPIKIIPNEFEAISTAIANAPLNSFIWYFPDNILQSIKFLKKFSRSNVEEKTI